MNLASVAANGPLAEQRIVGRHRLHRRDHGLAVGGATDLVDRLQIVQHGCVDAGLHVVGIILLRMAFGEPLGEGARAVVQIPVERIHDLCALRGLEAERGNAVHAEDQPDQLLLLRQSEFRRLLDRGDGVVARIGHADDVGARGLRLQQEGGVVGGAERMAHGADHFAAGGLDPFGGLLLQIMTERIVGGQEEPFLAALRDHGFA